MYPRLHKRVFSLEFQIESWAETQTWNLSVVESALVQNTYVRDIEHF